MNHIYSLKIIFGLIIVLCINGACNKGITSKDSFLPVASSIEDRIERVKLMQNEPNALRTFRIYEENQPKELEEVWLSIEQNPKSKAYRSVELYNIYKSNPQSIEYYIAELSMDLKKITAIQSLIEYQIVINPDTTFVSQADQREVKLLEVREIKYGGNQYELAFLEGFAHPGEESPDHLKFWSPQVGTVKIYYGPGYFYELESFPSNIDDELIALMKKEADAYIVGYKEE